MLHNGCDFPHPQGTCVFDDDTTLLCARLICLVSFQRIFAFVLKQPQQAVCATRGTPNLNRTACWHHKSMVAHVYSHKKVHSWYVTRTRSTSEMRCVRCGVYAGAFKCFWMHGKHARGRIRAPRLQAYQHHLPADLHAVCFCGLQLS